MPNAKYTIVYEQAGVHFKLCKIFFGKDGSYYVTSPYHKSNKATLLKLPINYSMGDQDIPFSEIIDVGAADQERLKLSHHPDGFVQFSGAGIVSGKNLDDSPKGLGVRSWSLDRPVLGPAFSLLMFGVQDFTEERTPKGDCCVFTQEEITSVTNDDSLVLEGYYFTALWRRFIQREQNGQRIILLSHPAGALMKLKVILPAEDCAIQGFIGLNMWGMKHDFVGIASGFTLSSSTGNLRRNERGELIGDGLICVFPQELGIPVPTIRLDYGSEELPSGNLSLRRSAESPSLLNRLKKKFSKSGG